MILINFKYFYARNDPGFFSALKKEVCAGGKQD